MKVSFKKSLLVIAFASAALMGCESRADKERKPSVADPMVTESVKIEKDVDAGYADRLREVLMHTNTKDLETLRDAGITVCLDKRLPDQETGAFDRPIYGVYYIKDKIVTIYDNPDAGFLGRTADSYGSSELEKLASAIRDGDVNPNGNYMFAATYYVSTGKGGYTTVRWSDCGDFDQAAIRKNPDLLKPPVTKPTAMMLVKGTAIGVSL